MRINLSFLSLASALSVSSMGLAQVASPLAKTYAEVEGIVAENCLSCHSAETAFGDVVLDTEANLKALAVQAAAAIRSGAMPVGNPDFLATPAAADLLSYLDAQTPAPVVFADVLPVLQASCLSCHTGSGARRGVRLDTEAFAIQNAARALAVVSAGRMPPRNPTFSGTANGQLLLTWLANPLPTPAQ